MTESEPVYAVTGCTYWTDHTNSSFNVDDPTFWPPLPVISGIASGFCERLAVAKIAAAGGTVTSGAQATLVTGATWTIGATTEPDLGSNNAIVSNVANGFATGATGTALYNTHNATFQVVGTSAGDNYMKAVDNAITSMVTMQDSYVDENGTAYSFNTLATAATTRAAARDSSIQTPVEGGTNFNAPFAPAYPVEWAKERKWMLDQLRYTGGAVVQTTAKAVQYDIVARYGQAGDIYDAGLSGASVTSAISSAYIHEVTAGTAGAIVVMVGDDPNSYSGPYFTYLTSSADPNMVISSPESDTRIPYALAFKTVLGGATVGTKITAFCGEVCDAPEPNALWDEINVKKPTTDVEAEAGSNYVIAGGATVALDGTATVGNVTVSSGGMLVLGASVTVTRLNIMDAGTVRTEGTTNDTAYDLNINKLFVNYRNISVYSILDPFYYMSTDTTATTGRSYYIDNGVLSVSKDANLGWVIANKGTVSITNQGSGGQSVLSAIMLSSGASLYISNGDTQITGNQDVNVLNVLSGGTATLCNAFIAQIRVMSGGFISMDNCSATMLCALDGSTINITGNTIEADYRLYNMHDIRVGTFETFNMRSIVRGWNNFEVFYKVDGDPAAAASDPNNPDGMDTAYVLGATTAAGGSSALLVPGTTAAVIENLPNIHGEIAGSAASSLLTKLNGVRLWKDFSVLAINGGTATGGMEDHYKDFRVRQYTDFTPPST